MFLKNGNTYVNLDLVSKAAAVGTRMSGRDTPAGFFGANGNPIDTGTIPDLEHATAPLVPSSAVVIAIDPIGRTTAHPVAAYRVLRGGVAEPVFTVAPPEDAVLFQVAASQGLIRLDDALFPNIDQARAAVLEMAPPAPANPEPEPEPVEQPRGKRHAASAR